LIIIGVHIHTIIKLCHSLNRNTTTIMENLLSSLDSTVIDLQTRKTIVIGSVGSGKTSLCRYVAGDYTESTESRLCGGSVTKGVKTYKGKYIGSATAGSSQVQYTMVDSEGYGADNFSSDNLRNQLFNSLKFETELNSVIICVSFERFRLGLKDDLSHLINVIKTLGLEKEHLLVVFTHCELYKHELREAYVKEFKTYYDFDFGTNYIFCCFTNMVEVNEDFSPIVIQEVMKSITKVREEILKNKTTINVAVKIFEMENN